MTRNDDCQLWVMRGKSNLCLINFEQAAGAAELVVQGVQVVKPVTALGQKKPKNCGCAVF